MMYYLSLEANCELNYTRFGVFGNRTSEASEKISLGGRGVGGRFGVQSPGNFCNYGLSIFNLRPFPTILRGLEKDHFCTYKDNGS